MHVYHNKCKHPATMKFRMMQKCTHTHPYTVTKERKKNDQSLKRPFSHSETNNINPVKTKF